MADEKIKISELNDGVPINTDFFPYVDGVTDETKKTPFNSVFNTRTITAASYSINTGTSLSFDNCDQFEITAQAGDLKFNNPSGTPTGGQKIVIRIKDNGTARALTYDTQYRAIGIDLPPTTIQGKTIYIGCIWNNTDSKLDIVATATEA